MLFLIRILIIVGLLFGGLYYYLKDSAIYAEFFPKSATVHGGESPDTIAARALYKVYKKDVHHIFSRVDLHEFYQESVQRKYDAASVGEKLTEQRYLSLEREFVIGNWLKRLDKNNDKQISESEWNGNAYAFAQIDRNEDGQISASEHWLVEEPSKKRWFSSADKNSDGSLSQDEFFVKYKSSGAEDDFVDFADANGNNSLDEREVEELAFQYGLR